MTKQNGNSPEFCDFWGQGDQKLVGVKHEHSQ